MALWLAAAPLVLASRSPARRALLHAAGVPLEVCPADIDEREIEAQAAEQAALAVAALLAREKAMAVAQPRPGRLVLGADQVLGLEGERFTKPPDRAAARSQLHTLSGRTHELYSAIAMVKDGTLLHEHVGVARLTMRSLTDQFIESYLDAAGDTVTASVGAYQLESVGIQLFERIDGDYFTVLGLPMMTVLDWLRCQGCLSG